MFFSPQSGTGIAYVDHVSHFLLLPLLFLWCSASFAGKLPEYAGYIDAPIPVCEQKVDLDISRELFVEIANQEPGVDEYNQLVRLFQRREWDAFKLKLEIFKKVYESSPLMEAAHFLNVQAQLDQVPSTQNSGSSARNAEKMMRNTIFLYPNSSLIPAISVGMGAFLLRRREYSRALGLFRSLHEKYPDHDLQCVFKVGMGESRFNINEWKESIEILSEVKNSCKNRRLKVAALVRIADSLRSLQSKEAEAVYDQVMEEHFPVVDRFYKATLYNLGELKYQNKKYIESKHFFDQFIKVELPSGSCTPYAKKRLADISVNMGVDDQVAIGKYLAVKEMAPATDIGHYSFARGLLLPETGSSKTTQERRVRVIDEEMKQMKNKELKYLIFLEKGLAGLRAGELDSLPYLLKMDRSQHSDIFQGPLGGYIRRRAVEMLSEKLAVERKSGALAARQRLSFLLPYRKVFEAWFENTDTGREIIKISNQMYLEAFVLTLKSDRIERAFELLEEWTQGEFWKESELADSVRLEMAKSLGEALVSLPAEPTVMGPQPQVNPEELAIHMVKNEKVLRLFLTSEFSYPWVAVAWQVKDKERLKLLLSPDKMARVPASIKKDSKLHDDIYQYIVGRGLNEMGEYARADALLSKVESKRLLEKATRQRILSFKGLSDYKTAVKLSTGLLPLVDKSEKPSTLLEILDLAEVGKQWNSAPKLLELAKTLKLKDDQLTRFLNFSGRSAFEQKKCRDAIGYYTRLIEKQESSPFTAEARYRMGKCHLSLKEPSKAEQVWTTLIAQKDDFWSPLAKNELRLVNSTK